MSKIVTITIHPTIDKYFTVHQLLPNSKLHVNDYIRKAGGGGINVSKILAKHDIHSAAIYASGGYNANLLFELLKAENIEGVPVSSTVECRENIIIYAQENKVEYRFNMPLGEHEQAVYKSIESIVKGLSVPDIIIISGSVGNQFKLEWYQSLFQWSEANNIKILIDTKAEVLKQIMSVGAFLIKPNKREFLMAIGKAALTNEQIVEEANAIIQKGNVQHILISMGQEGAYLVNQAGVIFYESIPVKAVNSVGAGDSLLAGVVLGINKGDSIKKAVEYGIHCAAATVINSNKTLFEWEDMKRIQSLL